MIRGREETQLFGKPTGWSVMCVNPTMDIALVTEVFSNLLSASEELDVDANLRPQWRDVLAGVAPWPVDEEQGLREFPPGTDGLFATLTRAGGAGVRSPLISGRGLL